MAMLLLCNNNYRWIKMTMLVRAGRQAGRQVGRQVLYVQCTLMCCWSSTCFRLWGSVWEGWGIERLHQWQEISMADRSELEQWCTRITSNSSAIAVANLWWIYMEPFQNRTPHWWKCKLFSACSHASAFTYLIVITNIRNINIMVHCE